MYKGNIIVFIFFSLEDIIILYFNSSMVRLRETLYNLIPLLLVDFNSSMVRLRVFKRRDRRVFTQFQFQYGAIKRVDLHVTFILLMNFNSSMVRLRDGLW